MDQTTTLALNDRRRAADSLAAFVAQSVDDARAVDKPFFHLEFDRVFPDDIYAQILNLMPVAADYRSMHGQSKVKDGTQTRVKIDLFPEYIRNLPAEKRAFWAWSAARSVPTRSSGPSSAVSRPACRSVSARTSPPPACTRSRS